MRNYSKSEPPFLLWLDIAREKFGGKDHSTVIHAVRKIETMMGEDPSLKETVSAVSRRIDTARGG